MKKLIAIAVLVVVPSWGALAYDLGVVYATDSGAIRRIINPSSELDWTKQAGEGETLLLVPREQVSSIADVFALVENITGKDTRPHRVAILSIEGQVEGFVMADPLVDQIPGKILAYAPDEAHLGDWYTTSGWVIAPQVMQLGPEPNRIDEYVP